MVKREKVVNLIEKIDKKKKELKQLKKDLQKAFNDISNVWKEESSRQFPQLSPCNIGEYVGVDITIKGKVYNIFISEYNQKLYCMFCLDRNDKNYSNLPLKKAMDQPDFDKLSAVVNDYLNQYDEKVCSTGDGYFVRFEKGQYDDAFLFYLDVVRTFVERQ
jgi:hypothetical protein